MIDPFEGSCRNCKHYYRVKKDLSMRNVMNSQGFCSLGQLCGDYGLYISSSSARDCQGFIKDDYNTETREKERELSTAQDDFRFALEDKRTKEYQLVKNRFIDKEEVKKFFDMKDKDQWVALHMNRHVVEAFTNFFYETHQDKFEWLWHRKFISQKDYHIFLNKLRTEFNDFTTQYKDYDHMYQ